MKRQLLISGLIATAVTAFGAAGITSGELDLPGLNQAINNLDARTTNNEQDIHALQAATSTTPAPHVAVPVAPTPVPTVTATPTPSPQAIVTPAPATPPPTPAPTPCPLATPGPGIQIQVLGACK